MSDCRHPVVETYAAEGGEPRLWACTECHIRFYPACWLCVSVGHRGEVHEDVGPPADLTPERLAWAIGTATDCGHSSCTHGRDTSRHLDDAADILAALAEPKQ